MNAKDLVELAVSGGTVTSEQVERAGRVVMRLGDSRTTFQLGDGSGNLELELVVHEVSLKRRADVT